MQTFRIYNKNIDNKFSRESIKNWLSYNKLKFCGFDVACEAGHMKIYNNQMQLLDMQIDQHETFLHIHKGFQVVHLHGGPVELVPFPIRPRS